MTLFPWLLGEAPRSLIYNAPKVSLDIFKTRKKLLAGVGVKSLQRLSYHRRGLRHSSPESHLPRRLLWGVGCLLPSPSNQPWKPSRHPHHWPAEKWGWAVSCFPMVQTLSGSLRLYSQF